MRLVYLIISLVALAYVVLRAWFVPFTCDEAWTFTNYFHAPTTDILVSNPPLANNHILNTLLIRLTGLFSTSEFALRLPNVLAFLLYAFASYNISNRFCSGKALSVLLFLVLMSNHTLLEFFALSRGYGISIGLMMMSLYYLLSFNRDNDLKKAHLSMVFIVLGTYASFVLLYVSLILFLLIFILQYRQTKSVLKAIKTVILYPIVLAALIAYPLINVNHSGDLFYGGNNNFATDTLGTLLQDFLGRSFTTINQSTLLIITVAVVAISILANLGILVKRNKKQSTPLQLVAIILTLLIVAINAQFYILGKPLPYYRTGMYLFPVIILSIFAILEYISIKYKQTIAISIAAILLLFAGYRFSQEANLNHTNEWWFDQYTPTVLNDIEQYKQAQNITDKSTLHVLFPTQCAFNYYIAKQHSTSVDTVTSMQEIVTEVDPSSYDFVYADKEIDMPASFTQVNTYGEHFILYANKKSKK